MTDDIFAEMEADALEEPEVASDEALAGIAKLVNMQVKLEDSISTQEANLKSQKASLLKLQTTDIPEALQAVGMKGWISSDGSSVVVEPFVSASITKARKDEALAWLDDNGHGDLIKRHGLQPKFYRKCSRRYAEGVGS